MSQELYQKWEKRFDRAYLTIIEEDETTRRAIAVWLGRTMNRAAPQHKVLACAA